MSGESLEVFDHFDARVFSGLMQLVFESLIPFGGSFFEEWFFFPFLLKRLDMLKGLILAEAGECFLEVGIAMCVSIYLVDRADVLGPHLVDNVGTVGLVSFFLLEESELTRLAKFLEVVVEVPVVKASGGEWLRGLSVLMQVINIDVGVVDDLSLIHI